VKRKLIAGAVVVILAAIWVFSSFIDSLTPYVSFDDARMRGSRVQVIGSIVKSSVFYDTDSLKLTFTARNEAGEEMPIVYEGSMPANFDQAPDVVCIGAFRDNRFHADELLLKCPSKYQGDS
jgi:cytochrome c-type biogenesis protein CcmE